MKTNCVLDEVSGKYIGKKAHQILQYLRNVNKPQTTLEIGKALCIDWKNVSYHLYPMLGYGLVKKVNFGVKTKFQAVHIAQKANKETQENLAYFSLEDYIKFAEATSKSFDLSKQFRNWQIDTNVEIDKQIDNLKKYVFALRQRMVKTYQQNNI